MLSSTSSKITCSICLGDIVEDNLCKTNSNHEFCKSCLDLWFQSHNNTCPMCRHEFPSEEKKVEEEELEEERKEIDVNYIYKKDE